MENNSRYREGELDLDEITDSSGEEKKTAKKKTLNLMKNRAVKLVTYLIIGFLELEQRVV